MAYFVLMICIKLVHCVKKLLTHMVINVLAINLKHNDSQTT